MYDNIKRIKVYYNNFAQKLAIPRLISLIGDISGNTIFDGSSNVVINTSVSSNLSTNSISIQSGNNKAYFSIDSNSILTLSSSNNRIAISNTAKTIANSNTTGSPGEFAWDNNYIYICVANNTWGRANLEFGF